MSEQIMVQPMDGQKFANGAIVGYGVSVGNIAATIERLLGFNRENVTSKATVTNGTLTRQLDEMTERLAQAGYQVAELKRDLSAEKERADENRGWAERTEEHLKAEKGRVAELERELRDRPTVAELHEAERTAARNAEAEMKTAYEAEKDRADQAAIRLANTREFRARIIELVNSGEVVQALNTYAAPDRPDGHEWSTPLVEAIRKIRGRLVHHIPSTPA